jgi:protein involved in polysaccharide export with SLBB domain
VRAGDDRADGQLLDSFIDQKDVKQMAGITTAAWMVSNSVTSLMEEVMRSMMVTKFKTAMATLLVLGMFTFGGGLLVHHTVAQEVEAGKQQTDSDDVGRAQALEKAPAPRKAFDKQKPERASSTSPITPSYIVMPPDILLVDVIGLPKEPYLKEVTCLVRPDGTISLGAYGSVHVAELTLVKIPMAIAAKLAETIGADAKVDVRVNVIDYNSKVYTSLPPGVRMRQSFDSPQPVATR